MTKLKYPKELYTGSGFFGGDMDCEYTNESEKLVKCRKSHKCVNCQKRINIGDYAVEDKALFNKLNDLLIISSLNIKLSASSYSHKS